MPGAVRVGRGWALALLALYVPMALAGGCEGTIGQEGGAGTMGGGAGNNPAGEGAGGNQEGVDLRAETEAFERKRIEQALRDAGNSLRGAARLLGVPRSTLYEKAKRYKVKAYGFDIDPERIRDSLANVKRNKVEDLVTIQKKDIFTFRNWKKRCPKKSSV